MNWRDFVTMAGELGIKDDTRLWFVDFHADESEVFVLNHDKLGVSITNKAKDTMSLVPEAAKSAHGDDGSKTHAPDAPEQQDSAPSTQARIIQTRGR